jgi:hypothetical protein
MAENENAKRGKLLYVAKRKFPPFEKLIIIMVVVFLIMGVTFGTLMFIVGVSLFEVVRVFGLAFFCALIISYTAYYFGRRSKKDLLRIYEKGITISYRSEGTSMPPPKSYARVVGFSPMWQLRFAYSFIPFENIKTFYTISSPNNKRIWFVFIEPNGKWYSLPTGGFEAKDDFDINEIMDHLKKGFGKRWEKVYLNNT